MDRRPVRRCLAPIAVALVLIGCSKNPHLATFPATGTVTLDGQALAGAEVWLVPVDGQPAQTAAPPVRPRGMADQDGRFTLTTYADGDGAPAGDYTAVVIWQGEGVDPEVPPEDAVIDRKPGAKRPTKTVPRRYIDAKTSGLTVSIQTGPNAFELKLKSK